MSNYRHPEKVKNKENPIPKKPSWIRVKAPTSKFFKSTDNFNALIILSRAFSVQDFWLIYCKCSNLVIAT